MRPTGERSAAFSDYLDSIPNLHSWDKGKSWNSGGFDRTHLTALHDLARAQSAHPWIIETGAGNSTLCFLHAAPERLVSVAPDAALFERIERYARAKELPIVALETHVERSEIVLPRLFFEERGQGRPFHLALIDGGHGWPTVFVDFCYLNALLGTGGLLAIDDIQLHSVKELARFLSSDARFPLVADLGKVLVFKKTVDEAFLPDFGGQPYIIERTRADEAEGKAFTLGVRPADADAPAGDERLRILEERVERLEGRLAELAAALAASPTSNPEPRLPASLVLTADMYLPLGTGFHDVEYDDDGRAFRWTGPGTDFFLAGAFDRREPCEVRVELLFANEAVPPARTRLFVDGIELALDAKRTEAGTWQLTAPLPPRAAGGETTFHFATCATFAPPGDNRRLGLAFARLACGPVGAVTWPAADAGFP